MGNTCANCNWHQCKDYTEHVCLSSGDEEPITNSDGELIVDPEEHPACHYWEDAF